MGEDKDSRERDGEIEYSKKEIIKIQKKTKNNFRVSFVSD
jgi:hypothetical protein